jgi:Skp family chaperone for outer membrane proteins
VKQTSMRDGTWTRWIMLALLACLVIFVWDAASNDRTKDQQPAVPVAVVDVGKVFRQHAPFNDQMAELKREIEEYERQYRREESRIEAMENADLKRKEAEMIALTLVLAEKRKVFLERESRIYEDIYPQVEDHVARISLERNIDLVINDDSREKKLVKGDRVAVMKAVSRVVLHCRAPDITEDVIKALNSAKP